MISYRPQEQNKAYVRHALTVACIGSTRTYTFGSIVSRLPSRKKTHAITAVTTLHDLSWQTSRATK